MSMKQIRKFRNENGMSLPEVVIALMMIPIVGFLAFSMMNVFVQASTNTIPANFLSSANIQLNEAIITDDSHDSKIIAIAVAEPFAKLEYGDRFSTAIKIDAKDVQVCAWDPKSNHATSANAYVLSDGKAVDIDCSSWTAVKKIDIPVVKSTPYEQERQPAPAFPWSMVLGILVSIVAGLGLISGGIMVAGKVSRAKREKAKQLKTWDNLIQRHQGISTSWAGYSLDASKLLNYPMLADMRAPVTVALYAALRAADVAKPSNLKKDIHEPTNYSVYEASVIALENAFHIAETEAKRIKWSNFSVLEQKRLRKAQDLLNLATNGGATEFERQAAYKAMTKELEGLLVVPEVTLASIESKIRLMITA